MLFSCTVSSPHCTRVFVLCVVCFLSSLFLVSLSWDGGWGSNFLGEFTRTGTHPKRLLRARDVANADHSREQNEESVSGDSIEINPSKY